MLYHILSTHFQKSESEIDQESYLGGKEDGGLHIWLINTIVKEFSSMNTFEANSFSAKMAGLKRMRTQSDYKNVYINDDSAEKARKTALETLKLLKKNFKI
ncbi:MAG TPA: hypothetical protein VNI52_12375 [Sphingobacteriaceae bacterium]|nr:hypothetical protein [Sphingobacteriaceae bacterium]